MDRGSVSAVDKMYHLNRHTAMQGTYLLANTIGQSVILPGSILYTRTMFSCIVLLNFPFPSPPPAAPLCSRRCLPPLPLPRPPPNRR